MRVLYMITRADLGGAQIHVLDLLAGFRNLIDPVVAVGEEGFFTEAVRDLGIPCHIVPNLVHPPRPVRDLRALWETVSLIRRVNPDLVHAHTSKAGVIARLAARWTGKPSVFTAHTWCFAEGTSWKWRFLGVPAERLAGSLGSAIINVSDANKMLALRHHIGRAGRLIRVWNGIADVWQRAHPGDNGIPTIVTVARFAPQKDHELLLRAAASLDVPFEIVFVGDGPTESRVRALARELGISDRIQLLGPRLDVPDILAAAQVFALPSKWEGFPLSILEAMRAGLPVIASDVGGVAEAVIDGTNGILVPSGDVGALRAGLRELLTNAALRERMGRAGRHLYESNFTVEAMLQQTLAVYRVAAGQDVAKSSAASEDRLSESSC